MPQDDGDLYSGAESQIYNKLKMDLKIREFNIFHPSIIGLHLALDHMRVLLQETMKGFHILGINKTHLACLVQYQEI